MTLPSQDCFMCENLFLYRLSRNCLNVASERVSERLTNVNDEANPHKLVRDGNETGKDPLNFHLALKCQ